MLSDVEKIAPLFQQYRLDICDSTAALNHTFRILSLIGPHK